MEKKTMWRFYHIFQYNEEAQFLREMHAKGWEFEDLALIRYRFRRCEPRDMVYQLDYNQEGLAHKEEYLRMFADCGWEYVDTMMGFCYFRKNAAEMNGREEIFSDDASKLEMVERIFKGRLIPLLVIFFTLIIPQLFIQSHIGHRAGQVIFGVYVGLFIAYVIIFALFAFTYYKVKSK